MAGQAWGISRSFLSKSEFREAASDAGNTHPEIRQPCQLSSIAIGLSANQSPK